MLKQLNHKGLVLGIDYGERFIGFAISDPLWKLARPLTLIDQKKEDTLKALHKLIVEHHISAVIIGYPLNMNGTEGPSCQKVQDFKQQIDPTLPVFLVDERLSTAFAENRMLEFDLSRAKRKKKIDQFAAAVILQTALDQYNFKQ